MATTSSVPSSLDLIPKDPKIQEDALKQKSNEAHMTSSTISTLSSLPSPVDSGVQLLDSESELTSAMTTSTASVDLVTTPEKASYAKNFPNLFVDTKSDLGDLINPVEKNHLEDLCFVAREIVLDIVAKLDVISNLDRGDNRTYLGNSKTQETENIHSIEKIIGQREALDVKSVNGQENAIKPLNNLENTANDDKDDIVTYKIDKHSQEHCNNDEQKLNQVDINYIQYNESKVDQPENNMQSLNKLVQCYLQSDTSLNQKVYKNLHSPEKCPEITKSDIINQNVCCENYLSCSVPNYFDKFSLQEQENSKHMNDIKTFNDDVFEMEHPINTSKNSEDLMNISLNSYELLDYTTQNINLQPPNDTEIIDMHVSLSEEVNENLKVKLASEEPIPEKVKEEIPKQEEQIVFRRQRRKKSKSDTPKKRVSFHEDILNSTKIDDVHINLGFVTHEPDVLFSFFQKGFSKRPDVVQGRYSWAAEGDAPFYEKNTNMSRDVQSDININNSRYSSTSSSSTGSVSSIDEEDLNSEENNHQRAPTNNLPKSSCLKKTKHKKYIDTKIVQEDSIPLKKSSQTNLNLLDKNIFGSLKNILSFSTSVPLAERGVPEGQEDVAVYSSSQDLTKNRRSFADFSYIDKTETKEVTEVKPETPQTKINLAKTNLKLTKSEGFYPNYQAHPELPANVIICDSNVYEHKGISYSYEYDEFQRSFEQQNKENKPKSSTLYQTILKEFNFFRKKAKGEPENQNIEDDFEVIEDTNTSTPNKNENRYSYVEEVTVPDFEEEKVPVNSTKTSLISHPSITKMDWSDTETISDITDGKSSKHLESPKKKINKYNHFSVQNSLKCHSLFENRYDNFYEAKSLPNLKPSGSKTSLINRFLKNVTAKKMLDLKTQQKQSHHRLTREYLKLYVKNCKVDPKKCNEVIDKFIQTEILNGKNKKCIPIKYDTKMSFNLKKQLFRNKAEELIRIFPVRSAYSTNGESKPLLLILTNTTLYVAASKQLNQFSNHFVLPYTELNAILIGPSCQTIHFSNYDLDMQCMISTGCSSITNDLIGQLEIAMRRDTNRPSLPAVRQLSMRNMTELRKSICKHTSVDKEEEYYYYSIVNIQDSGDDDLVGTPMGPSKEGPLMFKTSDFGTGRWETAYFILKAGVLYMLSSASQRVPMRVFPLLNGSCEGARRVFNSNRPHTFQVIVEGKSLQLAAPDEYVASEWLQELIHAASGIYHKEKNLTLSCSLMMTSEHVLTVREAFPSAANVLLPRNKNLRDLSDVVKGPQALSCASITDLVSFRLPSAEQSWCILEFSCREVHEYSGDWILYFVSNTELENFISTLELLWQYNNEEGESFPLSTIPETDPISRKCVDVYSSLMGQWPVNTVHLQFL